MGVSLMDLTAKRMYDTFKDQIWRDLGPLDPDWFESLTAEALAGHASDQEELCANQEALFKAPIENKGPCSQTCSTPKLFKRHPKSSLQPEDESFSAEPEMPWSKASPCVLRTDPSQMVNLISGLHTPKTNGADPHRSPDHSNTSFAKHISERLGATVGDFSWTSSLNTPPPDPSTFILSRKFSSTTVTLSGETPVLVRELFPSNSSVIVPESPDTTALQVPDTESDGSLQAPTKDKPSVPSAAENVDVHNEVNPDHATFCTMSSSILRKVRSERVTRRLINPLNDNGRSAMNVLPTSTTVLREDKSIEPPSGNAGLSQWSPLSLSEILTHSGVTAGKKDSGPKETEHEKDNSTPVGGLEAESKTFPASEQDQGLSVDNVTDTTLQRSQVPLTEPAYVPRGFSPAACLSALKRAKQGPKRGSVYRHDEIIQDPETTVKQSVHDSGFSSVAETTLVSSTNKSHFKLDTSAATDVEKEDICETICQSGEGGENNVSGISFKTASNKNINISPVSLKTAKNLFQNIEGNENIRPSRPGASNDDVHLTVSQKADVKELCALLEQQSGSQFDFTQPAVERANRKSSGTDPVKDASQGKAERKVEPISDEARRLIEMGDQTGNHLEGFKTAGGKGICVSAKNMQKSHNFFKDCDVAPDENESGFKITLVNDNKDNNVGNCSSHHITTAFKKPNVNVIDCVKANENTKPVGTKETPFSTPRRGFKRAHDAHHVSAKSAKRAKLLPPDCEGEKNITPHYYKPNLNSLQTNTTEEIGITSETLPSGFTTAGGKRVQLSKKNFEKVKHLWNDFDDGLKMANELCPTLLNATSTFESPAGGKASNAGHDSDDPQREIKPLLHEHNTIARGDHASLKLSHPYVRVKDSTPRTRGFLSANGKVLRISAEALLKAKTMFDDIGSASEIEKIKESSEMSKVATLTESVDNYAAQSTKSVKAHSKMADNRPSLHLSELSTERKSRLQNLDPGSCPLGIGFTTASGKKVAISEEALDVAKRRLTEEVETRNGLQNLALSKTILTDEPPSSFHKSVLASCSTNTRIDKNSSMVETPARAQRRETRHRSSVEMSSTTADANVHLKKSSKCGSNLHLGHSVTNQHNAPTTSGFSSASGKKLTVSEKALNQAINFLTEKNDQDSDANVHIKESKDGADLPLGHSITNMDNTCSNTSFAKNCRSGFSTASGKKVTVSEEALNKAMNFLTEKVEQDSDTHVQVSKRNKDRSSLPPGCSIINTDDTPASNNSCVKIGRSGFTTASGKKVTVSEEALNKAMNLLTEKNDQHCATNIHLKKENKDGSSLPAGHSITNIDNASSNISCAITGRSGFNTASGKKVTVSKEALNKAMNLLTEKVDQDTHTNPLRKKKDLSLPLGHSITDIDTPASNTSCVEIGRSGFTTASGKKVTVSEEALNKAMNLLTEKNDQDSDANLKKQNIHGSSLPPGRSTILIDDTQVSNNSCVKISGSGFTTASGKKVTVSEEALNKAMNFQTDNVDQDSDANVSKKNKDGSSASRGHSITNLNATSSGISCAKTSASGFTTASGNKVVVSKEALNKAINFLAEKVEQDSDSNVLNKKKDSSLLLGHSFTNLDGAPDSTDSNNPHLNNRSGFTTASGKKVSVSEEALNKAMNLLTEKVDQGNDAHVQVSIKHKDSSSLPPGHSVTILNKTSSNISCAKNRSGFSTASGKKVTVSEEALNKAMNFLTENVGQDGDANVHWKEKDLSSPLRHSVTNSDNIPSNLSCAKTSGSGFTTASGKKVTVSEEALNKVMNLLTENVDQDTDSNVSKKNKDGSSLPLGHSVTIDTSSGVSCPKNSASGFTTASGNKVAVSEEALNKAMNFLTEKIDLDSEAKTCTTELMPRESNATILQHAFVQPKFVNSKCNTSSNLISNLLPQVDMDVMKFPSVSLNIQRDAVKFSEYNQRKSPDRRNRQHCSMVNLDVPNLSNCTTTQQKFLAQEALDCTRALLEDEVRAAQSLTASLEQIPTPTAAGSHTGKRRLEEETDLPALGWKSPEDFDEALDRQKESNLNPVKSCVSGLSKDRRVFQYHVPLHPNITKPHRFGKDFVNTQKPTGAVPSTPVKSGQADLKTALFVPPFLNTRAKAPKDDVGAQKGKEKPCSFVPPFKKLKSEGSSVKTQHEDDNFGKEFPKSGTFLPPTRKSQSPDTFPDRMNERSEATNETEEAHDGKATEQRANEQETMEADETQQEIRLNVENLDLARDLQDMRIRKSRQTIRPIPGSLFLSKSSQNRRSFRAVVDGQTPRKYSQKQLYTHGVDQPVCQITSETAEEFCFNLLKFHKQESFLEAGGVQLADGGWLVPRRDGTAGKGEFYRALCDTPGVDPKLLSQSWVSNHYRWVVWKLASMERSFPAPMASVCLTPEQVLLQLKYRYDVEVDHSRRPCLRKIMERDDTSAKTLVLCVCGVFSAGTPQDARVKPEPPGAVVWLTDGWYAIKAQLDEPLTALLHRGAISEGVKLMTHGAQLVGSQEACAPLEAPENLLLKIFANSTRRARWDAKLGFYKDPRPFVLPLSSIFSAGGAVCCVDMVILRVYPVQWMERKPDGGVVFRSERAEEKEARRYNNLKQKTMEAVYAKIKTEFENEEKERLKSQGRRRTVRREDLSRCQDGEELFEAVGDEASEVEAYLTPEQQQSLGAYRRALLDQRQAVLQERLRRAVEEAEASEGSCPKRDMATVWRLCISDYRDQAGSTAYQLSIWNPSSDVQAALKEGGRYEASHLTASDGRTQSGRATVQLASTRKTHFRNLQASAEWLQTRFQPRVSVTFAELRGPGFASLCGEVDLTGCVISVIDQHGPSPAFYLADGCLDLVKVHSLVSFARCGWEELLEPRRLVCLSNLQVRAGCAGPTPVLYAGDMSALSTQPREGHLRQALAQLQQAIQDQEEFFARAEERLSDSLSFPAVNPRTPQSSKTGHDLRTSVGKRQSATFTPTVRTPGPTNPLTKKDPRSAKRRRALDYICQFPPPPPLSHLSSVASPSVKKTFLPPRRSSVAPPSAPGTAGQTPRSSSATGTSVPGAAPEEEGWVHDDELALIDTQELLAADALLD